MYVSQNAGCHSFPRQKTLTIDYPTFCVGMPVVLWGGRCTVTWLPNFLRWVVYRIFLPMMLLYKGPDALDWQNVFGTSKNRDKICLCQTFNLVIVGALRNFFFRSCRANCKICTVFTPDKTLSFSKAGSRLLKVGNAWQNLVGKKITGRTCITEIITNFFAKYTKICLVRPGPNKACYRNTCSSKVTGVPR